MTVTRKPDHRGERAISRKTIAQGMPGDSGVTVVTTLVCSLNSHTRLRAQRAPGIPCALRLERALCSAKLARNARRDRETVSGCLKIQRVCTQTHSSCPGLTRASIFLLKTHFFKKMDCRVEPGNDGVSCCFKPRGGSKMPAARTGAHPARSSTTRREAAGSACVGRVPLSFPE
jgi:hypothetical protein